MDIYIKKETNLKSQFATSKEKGVVEMDENEKMEVVVVEKEQLNKVEINENTIKNLIYVVRGQQVMLDSDLAMLYQVETKVFNQDVKRNIERFPDEFRFRLTRDEYNVLRSQFVTSKGKGGRRYMPYVFTEQGIAMLSAVLRSDIAIKVSIRIMSTFVEMRRFMANNSIVLNRINEIEVKQLLYQKETDEKFEENFNYISEHQEVSQKVFFEGQIYDAFSLFIQLVAKAEKSIVLIDNYVDVGTLNILAKKNKDVEVKVYTLKSTKLSQEDINNFNQQYKALEINYTNMFHDRFLIIDDSLAYHIGASLKDAGKKCFAINKIEDKIIVEEILGRLSPKEGGE